MGEIAYHILTIFNTITKFPQHVDSLNQIINSTAKYLCGLKQHAVDFIEKDMVIVLKISQCS